MAVTNDCDGLPTSPAAHNSLRPPQAEGVLRAVPRRAGRCSSPSCPPCPVGAALCSSRASMPMHARGWDRSGPITVHCCKHAEAVMRDADSLARRRLRCRQCTDRVE